MNYLGFTKEKVKETTGQLNLLLANYQVYYQNLRNYHWNVTGQHFFDLHTQFEDLYNDAKVSIDEIAERILTLRMKPMSTMKEYLENSNVKELSTMVPKEMVESVLHNHKILIENMRNLLSVAADSNDEGTVDLVSGFLSSIEKKSWMLDSWLQE